MNNIEKRPYFMSNPSWYKIKVRDYLDVEITLTDKAPDKAVESYNIFKAEKEKRVNANRKGN